MQAKLKAFERLLVIMDELREQCPWDKKQTMKTLRHLTIEECYELTDAILDEDMNEIKGELGDIMLHLVFYSKIASEQRQFDVADVLNTVCDKLIHRHPHIYGDITVNDEEEVKANWEKLKLKEGKTSILQGVPKSLPAMVKATRIQDKVKGVGFEWDSKKQVWDKVEEEIAELKAEELAGNKDKMEAEFGDVFFSLINYARWLDIDPETALARTNKKFINRFQFMEKAISTDKKKLGEMDLAEMDTYWDKAKSENL